LPIWEGIDFKDTIEIRGVYKSTGFTKILLIVKTKFGLITTHVYDFGMPSGSAVLTTSGSEVFLKVKF